MDGKDCAYSKCVIPVLLSDIDQSKDSYLVLPSQHIVIVINYKLYTQARICLKYYVRSQ